MCRVVCTYVVRERDGGGRGGVHAARRGREQQLALLAVGEGGVRDATEPRAQGAVLVRQALHGCGAFHFTCLLAICEII